jgi:hypothetical protein
MSYAITIRRVEPIAYDEWLAVARADADLSPAGESEWHGPTGLVRYQVFEWTPMASAPTAELMYVDGRIIVDHAQDAWTSKLAELASKLGAQAVGDDGEVYGHDGVQRPAEAQRRRWWRRLLRP